jgi:hypothetical protein
VENADDITSGDAPKKRLTDTSAGQAVFVGLWMLGTLATIAALIGAFFLGRLISEVNQPQPVTPVATAPEVVEIVPLTGKSQQPGQWEWFELMGGECVTGFQTAFDSEFTVVPCELPHDAELIHAELVSSDQAVAFPGEENVVASAKEICDLTDRINREAASAYADLIVDYSYPASADQWDAGYRGVYCFVTRSSGDFMAERLSR